MNKKEKKNKTWGERQNIYILRQAKFNIVNK